uniref:Uncharacterized protein n=1 Tax=Parascaris univalens TaxID=6257 RepID=A0A915BCS5_PARUN
MSCVVLVLGVYYFEDVEGSENEQEYSKNYYVIMIPRKGEFPVDLGERCQIFIGGRIPEISKDAYPALFSAFEIEAVHFRKRFKRIDPQLVFLLKGANNVYAYFGTEGKKKYVSTRYGIIVGNMILCAVDKVKFKQLHPVPWQPDTTTMTTTTTNNTITATTTTTTSPSIITINTTTATIGTITANTITSTTATKPATVIITAGTTSSTITTSPAFTHSITIRATPAKTVNAIDTTTSKDNSTKPDATFLFMFYMHIRF